MLNDETKAEIVRLSQMLHDGKYAPSRKEYQLYADLSTGATNINTLTSSRHGRLWVDIVKEAGAPPPKFMQAPVRRHNELNAKGRYLFYWETNLETKAP